MSNEELAARIKAGEQELIPELWEQVRNFVWQQARRRFVLTGGYGGVEVEDLAQSGYLALLEAVEAFDPDGGYSFLACLRNYLKTAFARAGGYRTSKRDPLNACISFDDIVGDDPDGSTLLELQADPIDYYEIAEHKIWLDELHSALEAAMEEALSDRERDTVRRHYWQNETLRSIGDDEKISVEMVRQIEKTALRKLSRNRKRLGLEQFIEQRTPYYAKVGMAAFNATHTSAVELAVLKREGLEALYLSEHEE